MQAQLWFAVVVSCSVLVLAVVGVVMVVALVMVVVVVTVLKCSFGVVVVVVFG